MAKNMDFGDVVDDRDSAFRRPTTKRDILRGRDVENADNFEYVVPALIERGQKAVVIGPNVEIFGPSFYNAVNFSKRGPVVWFDQAEVGRTGKFVSIVDKPIDRGGKLMVGRALDLKVSPEVARVSAERSGRYSDRSIHHSCWGWADQFGIVHMMRPSIAIESRRLHIYGLLTGDLRDRAELRETKRYSARDAVSFIYSGLAPSKSGDKWPVTLEGIEDQKDKMKYAVWWQLSSKHDCPFKRNDITHRSPRVERYCHHDGAVFAAVAQRVARELEDQDRQFIFQTFPLFSEPMARLHLSLIYDTMKVDLGPTGRANYRPLSWPEIDAIEMDAWKYLGNRATFWATAPKKGGKLLRSYDWNIHGESMPFEKIKSS